MHPALKRLLLVIVPASALLTAAVVLAAPTPAEKGLEIAKKSDAANSGFKGETSTMEMTLINAHGDQIVRRMLSRIRETANDGDQSIITFEWPADVKGTRMLTWTHKTTDDDQWLYLPSLKRVKRISSSSKTGSFMGSEFSYEDLGSQEVEKFTYKYEKDEVLNGRPQWLIERVPVDADSGYSKQLLWMDQQYMNPVQIQYFDRKGELLKTAKFENYKQYGNLWRVGKIDMTNHQTQKRSVLTWQERKLGQPLPESEFREERLRD